jgi:hypothetical protein
MMAAMMTNRSPFRSLAILSLLALAACNGAAQSDGGPQVTATGTDMTARTETAMLPPVDRRTLTPERLKGLHAVQVEDALGAPGFRRRDPPAEIWQYRVGLCTLDLFLYKDAAGTTVAHYAIRSPSGTSVSEKACLDEVLNRAAGKPIS